MMRLQHGAFQQNNFGLRLQSWKQFLPMYCYYMRNYARYGSYYVELMDFIDGQYPGLRATLSTFGLSVQV